MPRFEDGKLHRSTHPGQAFCRDARRSGEGSAVFETTASLVEYPRYRCSTVVTPKRGLVETMIRLVLITVGNLDPGKHSRSRCRQSERGSRRWKSTLIKKPSEQGCMLARRYCLECLHSSTQHFQTKQQRAGCGACPWTPHGLIALCPRPGLVVSPTDGRHPPRDHGGFWGHPPRDGHLAHTGGHATAVSWVLLTDSSAAPRHAVRIPSPQGCTTPSVCRPRKSVLVAGCTACEGSRDAMQSTTFITSQSPPHRAIPRAIPFPFSVLTPGCNCRRW